MAASVTANALVIHPLTGKLFVDRDLLTFCATPPRARVDPTATPYSANLRQLGGLERSQLLGWAPKSQSIAESKSKSSCESKLFLSVQTGFCHWQFASFFLLFRTKTEAFFPPSLGARRVPGFRFCRSHWPRSRRFIFRRNLSGLQSSAASFSSPIAPSQREGEGARQMDINVCR